MPLINLLPETVKKSPHPTKKDTKAPVIPQLSPEIPFKLPLVIIVPLFLLILGGLFVQVNGNEKKLAELNKKSTELKTGRKKLDELTAKKKEIEGSIAFLKENSQNKTIWTQKLYLIHKLLPAQVWLTNINLESKTTKPDSSKADLKAKPQTNTILTIKGSATSLVEPEIISSITQFVEALKKDADFVKEFPDIKLGSLQSDKRGNLIIMSFVIYCKS